MPLSKKLPVLLLTLFLTAGMLAGCGAAKTDQANTASDAGSINAGAPGDAETAEGGNTLSSYEVLVNDESGKPVPGVTVQFCSDTECLIGKTDEQGIAAFDKEAGTYTVHMLKVPEGYAADDTEYSAPTEPGRLTIELLAETK